MEWFTDVYKRKIRLSEDRRKHIEDDHLEMADQFDKIHATILNPDLIIRSKTDPTVEMFYQHYKTTPVTEKYLCVVIKVLHDDLFVITAYFTDSIKKGETLWRRK